MEEFALLGNAAAVPIIIGTTQLLKKNFSFKYKADVVSFVVALIICPLWWFYHTPEAEIIDALNDGVVPTLKFVMSQIIVAVATYMTASKSYDLFSGNRKRAGRHKEIVDKHESEKKVLAAQLEALQNGSNDEPEDDSEISDKLLEILEGRE